MGKPNTPGCNLTGSCCVVNECALTFDQLGYGISGWTEVFGTWTDDEDAHGKWCGTPDNGALRLVTALPANNNLNLEINLGTPPESFPGTGDIIAGLPAGENRWRFFIAQDPSDTSDALWVEVTWLPANAPLGTFSVYWVCVLRQGTAGDILAWMAWSAPLGFRPTYLVPKIIIQRYAPYTTFCLQGIEKSLFWWGDGSKPDGFAFASAGACLCVNSGALHEPQHIGIGTAGPVDYTTQANFYQLIVSCQTAFTCDDVNPPHGDPPPDDDPGAPTGCCNDLGTLQLGDTCEVSGFGISYWFGSECDDPDCAITSDFLTLLNATHNVTFGYKDANVLKFYGYLTGLPNPCDNCAGVALREDLIIRFDARIEVWIEKNGDGTCTLKAWLWLGSCTTCYFYFQSPPFGESYDCDGIIAPVTAGDALPSNPPQDAKSCCLQCAGELTFTIP